MKCLHGRLVVHVLALSSILEEAYPYLPKGPFAISKLSNRLTRRSESCLHQQSNARNLSASERERREEEKRRLDRAGEVVVGKTSAIPGSKDYAINARLTEEEWIRSASDVEQRIFRLTEQGVDMLRSFRLDEADEAFSRVFQLKPDAYLWQAGIVKFYLGDLWAAADIFARCAATYESRFGEPASEERIWRDACALKLLSSRRREERSISGTDDDAKGSPFSAIASIEENERSEELLKAERRKVFRLARELFSASVNQKYLDEVVACAQLRTIGCSPRGAPRPDRKMWRLSSRFYLGLYYDATGDFERSKKCMKAAIQLNPSFGKSDDIIHTLPMLHMTCRDWFDDDDFQEEEEESSKESALSDSVDPVFIESVKVGLANLRYADLQEALELRGLRIYGSKEELQERLLNSILSDFE